MPHYTEAGWDCVANVLALSDAQPAEMVDLHVGRSHHVLASGQEIGARQSAPVVPSRRLLDFVRLAAGIFVRSRQRKHDDDVTVKLRPCRRSELPKRWLEGDAPGDAWSRSSRTAASIRLNIDEFTLLPGVTARRWKPVAIGGIDADVDLERWTVDDLDFLEFSVKLDSVHRAAVAQRRLDAELQKRHVPTSTARETKTTLVLSRLVELHQRAATLGLSSTRRRR